MKMKKQDIKEVLALLPFCLLAFLLLISCDDKLDIVPKGQSTLETVDDLELLLNKDIKLGVPNDLDVICDESVSMGQNIGTILQQANTLDYAYLAYDEKVDRAQLAQSDSRYTETYKAINAMNTIIEKAPEASGSDAKRQQIIAEAHVMRAYLHWLLVNIYARQYDEATAGKDGGIAYVTSNSVFADNPKLTVKEVYDHILDDCSDAYIAALPQRNHDVLRGDQTFGNAVRAKVLMQMKRYAEALPYALNSLSINGTIEDRADIVDKGDWVLDRKANDNLLYMCGQVSPFTECTSRETAARFEAGDYVLYHAYMGGHKPEAGDDDDDDDDGGDDDYYDDAKAFHAATTQTAAPAKAFADDDFDASSSAWNSLYGQMMSGLDGSLMYFAMSAWGNAYGITSDRMYYIAAECYIRTGEIQKGLELINKVRQNRIDADHYQPLTASTEAQAMKLMQDAKWIECIGSYENFFDCKRWNTEEAYRRTITRDLGDNGKFSISPDSKLWVLPFPLQATRKNAALTNNF